MVLTARQIDLVQNTWSHVLTHKQEAGELFYERLFVLDPSLQALFRGSIKSQASQLIGMITFAVSKLDRLNEIIADVKALGIRHKNYQVKKEHYATVAEALLWTLQEGLGEQWTEEVKNAWVIVYTLLATTMQDAANEN